MFFQKEYTTGSGSSQTNTQNPVPVYSWGDNSYDKLGIGNAINQSSPVQLGSLSNWQNTTLNASTHHIMFIKNNGSLWGWGNNSYGQLGISSTTGYSSPIQIGALNNWAQVTTGDANNSGAYTLAVKTDGTLWAWGQGTNGALGTGSTSHYSSPVQIGALANWSQIVGGTTANSFSIKTDGTLWVWGYNSNGELGMGNVTQYLSPVQLGAFTWKQISSGSYGTSATFGIRSDGTLWGWGKYASLVGAGAGLSSPVQIGSLANWAQISLGNSYMLAIKTDGSLWASGSGAGAASGTGNASFNSSSPVQVGALNNWSSVYAGDGAAFAIKTDGTLWSWGNNTSGQLGIGTATTTSSPIQVGSLTSWNYASNLNNTTTIATRTDGTIWFWGDSQYGMNGNAVATKYSSPAQIGALNNWKVPQLFMDSLLLNNSLILLRNDSTLWSVGNNNYGQLGLGDSTARVYPEQITTGGTNWSSLANTGYETAYAIQTNGTVWGWGYNASGQLGISNSTNAYMPVQVGTANSLHSSSISSNSDHTMEIKSDGSLWGCGYNASGQLGTGDTISYSSPVQIGALTTWLQVFAGASCTLAIQTNGTLWSWGNNTSGQLGQGNTTSYSNPVQVGSSQNWSQITIGGTSTNDSVYGIQNDSTLWAWGCNTSGQLGIGTNTNQLTPFKFSGWQSTPICSVSGGRSVSMIKSDGTLWSWGYDAYGSTGLSSAINTSVPIQTGTSTWKYAAQDGYCGAFIRSDGTLWTAGYNVQGQLGNGSTHAVGSGIYPMIQIGLLTNWKQIAVMNNSSMIAVKTDGTMWSWGNNTSGQLGLGDRTSRSSPVQIGSLTTWNYVASTNIISNGYAIKTDGTLWAWGANTSGELGQGDRTSRSSPVQVGSLTNWSFISGGINSFIAVKTDGTLWGCGYGGAGELGNGSTSSYSSPIQIGAATNWKWAATGWHFTYAIKTDGTLWSCGLNANKGQLGQGDTTNRSTLTQIGNSTNWNSIVALADSFVATKTDGTMWSCGYNLYGELGTGSTQRYSSPVQIGSMNYWSNVSVGSRHTVGIQTNGSLWAWGSNASGQLGIGSITGYSYPVQVGLLTNWNSISCGSNHAIATQTNGSLWSWGSNTNGQLGQNSVTSLSSPVQVGASTTWNQITAQANSSYGTKTNGTLWSWGNNTYGELGQGTVTPLSSPVQVGASTTWNYVTGGDEHMIARTTDGSLWAWGYNNYGQLGTSDISNYSSPTQVGSQTNWSSTQSTILNATYVAGGGAGTTGFALITNSSGQAWAIGDNTYGQLGTGNTTAYSSPVLISSNNWAQVACNSYNSLALKTTGTLWAMGGYNQHGELGQQNTIQYSSPIQIGALTKWKSIVAGSDHIVALNNTSVYTWGNNNYNQLVTGDLIAKSSPVQIGSLINWNYSNPGSLQTMFVKTNGTLWGWGLNTYGNLGQGNLTSYSSPVQVGALATWKQVATGDTYNGTNPNYDYTLAVDVTNKLWAWGYNALGQLGTSNITNYSSPVQVGAMTNWSQVTTGANGNSFAIKTDGTLWGWGHNQYGGLGTSNTTNYSSPVQVGALTNWSSVAGSSSTTNNNTVAIKTNGTLWSWGTGSLGATSSPIQVGALTTWKQVSCGSTHTMAVKTDGTLWGWCQVSGNPYGQLGTGDINSYSSPVQIGALTTWSLVSCDSASSFAIKSDGSLWSWGYNNKGQLSTGDTNNYSSPVQIGSLVNWNSIFCNSGSIKATQITGNLLSWGNNATSGLLGQGSNTTPTSSPVQIGTLTNWAWASPVGNTYSGVLASSGSTILLGSDGNFYVAGRNDYGQLGLLDTTTRIYPQQIDNSKTWVGGKGAMSSYRFLGLK